MRGIVDREEYSTEQKAKSISSSRSSRSRTNNAVPNGGGPRILSTLVSSASPGDCGSMGVGVFGSGFAAALFGAGFIVIIMIALADNGVFARRLGQRRGEVV